MDIDDDINELSMLEFIHNIVETLDKYFENVCELDVSLFWVNFFSGLTFVLSLDNVQHREGTFYNWWDGNEWVHRRNE